MTQKGRDLAGLVPPYPSHDQRFLYFFLFVNFGHYKELTETAKSFLVHIQGTPISSVFYTILSIFILWLFIQDK